MEADRSLGFNDVVDAWNAGALVPIDASCLGLFVTGCTFMDSSVDEDNLSGKLAVEWRPDDVNLVYGSISTGFKETQPPSMIAIRVVKTFYSYIAPDYFFGSTLTPKDFNAAANKPPLNCCVQPRERLNIYFTLS